MSNHRDYQEIAKRFLNILVIDDNPGDTRLVKEALAEARTTRFEVTHLPHLHTAINEKAWKHADLVLLDLHFPTLDAEETLTLMHDHLAHELPVVVMTSLDDEQIALRAIRSGAQDYVVKGRYEVDLLARTLCHAHERFQLLQALEHARQRQWELANYDALTRLPNRRLLQERLEQSILRRQRTQEQFAVLFIDIDGFKPVNDSLGHGAGDQLLQAIAERLRLSLRESDVAARLGGDEFALLITHLRQSENAAFVARKLLERLTAPFEIDGQEVFIGASLGISLCPEDGQDSAELLRRADMAMYAAKKAGGSGYRYYSETLSASADNRLALINGLRQALANDDLELAFQPIIELGSGRIIAMEALLRWHHPQFGRLLPEEFLALAEENNLIIDLDNWVLRTACWQNKRWQEAGLPPLRVTVNFAMKHLTHCDVVRHVSSALETTGLHPRWLEIELLESAIGPNLKMAAHQLMLLRELGIHIAVDNFSMGYAVNYLRELPIDTLKLDHALVAECSTDTTAATVCDNIIQSAQQLKLTVVAKGIERAEQAATLMQKGCRLGQGFGLIRPQSTPDLVELSLQSRALCAFLAGDESSFKKPHLS